MWRGDPAQFVRDNFNAVPDLWQEKALKAFVANDVESIRISLQACAG